MSEDPEKGNFVFVFLTKKEEKKGTTLQGRSSVVARVGPNENIMAVTQRGAG